MAYLRRVVMSLILVSMLASYTGAALAIVLRRVVVLGRPRVGIYGGADGRQLRGVRRCGLVGGGGRVVVAVVV